MNPEYRRHGLGLIIKSSFIVTALVTLSYINEYPFGFAFLLSLVIVPLSYVIGDLFILPTFNNTVATIADVGLTLGMIWLLGPFILGFSIPFSHALMTSLIIGGGELFFHRYVSRFILFRKRPSVDGS